MAKNTGGAGRDNPVPLTGWSINTRRGFLKIAITALASLIGIVTGIPVIRSIVPSSQKRGEEWSRVDSLTSLSVNTPKKLKFPVLSEDAYIRNRRVHSVWVVARPEGGVTVFSPVCTHLGCYYTWNGKRGRFECPCHASVFSIDGTVLSGPAPRPLDSLPHKIEKGILYVKWTEYRSGMARKEEV